MDFFTYKIIDERGENGNPSAPKSVGEPNEDSPVSPKDKSSKNGNIGLDTVKKIGEGAVNLAISHIGDFTGSTALQNKVNAGAQLVGTAISIAQNPAMGIASLALQIANKAMEMAHEKKMDSIAVAEATKRAGVSFNQSRIG